MIGEHSSSSSLSVSSASRLSGCLNCAMRSSTFESAAGPASLVSLPSDRRDGESSLAPSGLSGGTRTTVEWMMGDSSCRDGDADADEDADDGVRSRCRRSGRRSLGGGDCTSCEERDDDEEEAADAHAEPVVARWLLLLLLVVRRAGTRGLLPLQSPWFSSSSLSYSSSASSDRRIVIDEEADDNSLESALELTSNVTRLGDVLRSRRRLVFELSACGWKSSSSSSSSSSLDPLAGIEGTTVTSLRLRFCPLTREPVAARIRRAGVESSSSNDGGGGEPDEALMDELQSLCCFGEEHGDDDDDPDDADPDDVDPDDAGVDVGGRLCCSSSLKLTVRLIASDLVREALVERVVRRSIVAASIPCLKRVELEPRLRRRGGDTTPSGTSIAASCITHSIGTALGLLDGDGVEMSINTAAPLLLLLLLLSLLWLWLWLFGVAGSSGLIGGVTFASGDAGSTGRSLGGAILLLEQPSPAKTNGVSCGVTDSPALEWRSDVGLVAFSSSAVSPSSNDMAARGNRSTCCAIRAAAAASSLLSAHSTSTCTTWPRESGASNMGTYTEGGHKAYEKRMLETTQEHRVASDKRNGLVLW